MACNYIDPEDLPPPEPSRVVLTDEQLCNALTEVSIGRGPDSPAWCKIEHHSDALKAEVTALQTKYDALEKADLEYCALTDKLLDERWEELEALRDQARFNTRALNIAARGIDALRGTINAAMDVAECPRCDDWGAGATAYCTYCHNTREDPKLMSILRGYACRCAACRPEDTE